MKYCNTCKALYFDESAVCASCKRRLRNLTEMNEPVRLCIIGGTERAMLCGMLDDAGIPYMEQNVQPQGLSNDIVTGYDVKLSNISLLVPFSALPKASELLSSITTVKNDIEPHLDEITAQIAALRSNRDQDHGDKPMSPALCATVKVITALLFLALVALVVFGTDALTDFIKGLF